MPVQLLQAWRHHREKSQHAVRAVDLPEALQHDGHRPAGGHWLVICGFGGLVPPFLERLDLGGLAIAILLGEEDVVVLGGVERRVEMHEVDRLVLHVAVLVVEVVAVVERAGHERRLGGCGRTLE